MSEYILSIDQGTTSTKAFLLGKDGTLKASCGMPLTQHYPKPGYVEHDPDEIYFSVLKAMADVITRFGVQKGEIKAVAITNQRETTICFDKETLRPLHPAICWQCRRTADICKRTEFVSRLDEITYKTGLKLDPYFSATKMRFIFENVKGAADKAKAGKVLCGTVDSYLVYRLTGKKNFLTDYSNASRTMLFNIRELKYDEALTDLFDIPVECLAKPVPSGYDYGEVSLQVDQIPLTAAETEALEILNGVHITGVAGDQAAALFGQTCFSKGESKTTFGTGCFTLMNIGSEPLCSKGGLLTSVACTIGDEVVYALEGSVFQGGSIISWLKDEMGLIKEPSDCDRICSALKDNGGVYMVPAFTGLGAPYWNSEVRGAVLGLTRGTGGDYIVRAGVEAIAYQVAELIRLMQEETGIKGREMKVDGGVCACDFLMQLQSDILDMDICRARSDEMTAMGVGMVAGLYAGFFENKDELRELYESSKVYKPKMDREEAEKLLGGYKTAVRTLLG
ncbi:MAG: glycerol kinase [Clostridiales bacterium]|nr:glycerol kinase [Clostridiales bacterium]